MPQNKRNTTKTTTTTTKRSGTSNQNRRRRRGNNSRQAFSSALHIAPCTRLYAKALVNPFGVQGSPCIPDNIILPSYKITTKARGVFSTGTNGTGFCILDPFQMVVNNGANDAGGDLGGAIKYTTTAYTGNDNVTIANGTTGVNTANSNSMLAVADFDTGNVVFSTRQLRLVGGGIKIKYVGSNFRNQGRVFIFRNQGGESINNNTSSAQFCQNNYTSMTTVLRRDQYVFYVPDDPAFIAYNNLNTYYEPLFGTSHYHMGFMIVGGDTDTPQSWSFEAVAHFELVGAGFTLSKSEGDPVGHDIVLSCLPNAASIETPVAVEQSVMSKFVQGFTETTREVAYQVGSRMPIMAANVASAAMNYYSNRQGQLYLT
jgi:hypothetical protein